MEDSTGEVPSPSEAEIKKPKRIEIKPFEYPWKKPDWKDGEPKETINFEVGNQNILLANFNGMTISERQMQEVTEVLNAFAQHFPDILAFVKYIVVSEKQYDSAFGDEEKFPLNGYGMMGGGIGLTPRALEDIPHRIDKISNWKGTLTHEITHQREGLFIDKWKEIGDKSITEYGEHNAREDLCDSMVAYLFDPKKLEEASSGKYNLLKGADKQREPVEVKMQKAV